MGLLYLYLLYALKLLELNETEKSDRTADDLAVRSRSSALHLLAASFDTCTGVQVCV